MDVWLAFVAAATLILMLPGPTTLVVVGYSYHQGRTMALVLAITVATAHATTLSLIAAGLGVLIENYPAILTSIQIGGAAYLVYLMIRTGSTMWRKYRQPLLNLSPRGQYSTRRCAITRTYLVTLLNPNSFVFFIALLPQFINTTKPAVQQLIIMSVTFVILSAINSAVFGLSATQASRKIALRRNDRVTLNSLTHRIPAQFKQCLYWPVRQYISKWKNAHQL